MDEKELQRLYKAISGKFDIGDFNTFKSKMSSTESRKKFYDAIGQQGLDLGDYNEYEERLAGLKKKELSLLPPSAETTQLSSQQPAVKQSSIKEQFGGYYENIPANKSVSTYVKPVREKSVADFEDKTAEKEARNIQVRTQALETTATRRLKAKKQEVNEKTLAKEKELLQKDIDEGKVELSVDAKGNKIYGRKPGIGESLIKGLKGSVDSLSDAATIAYTKATGSPEELANLYEMISFRKKRDSEREFTALDLDPIVSSLRSYTETTDLPTAAPGTVASIAEFGGHIAPDIVLAAATGGAGNVAKMGSIGTKMYASSYGNKAYELYERGKQDLINRGMSEKEASVMAAEAATENAKTAAIPDAAINTLFFSGKLHTPAANNLISVIKAAAKDIPKIAGLGAAGTLVTSAEEASQGYDVGDPFKKAIDAGGDFAKLEMIFKAIPIMAQTYRTLPKAAKSALKEFAIDPVVKPLVEAQLKDLPNKVDIMRDINEYEAETKNLRGVVSEEKMASLGGRMQKRVNRINDINTIKEEVKQLEEKKKELPEALHEEIDVSIKSKNEEIKSLQKEIGNIDAEIAEINKSKGTGLEKEIDEVTGEKLFTDEEISQPIELSTEVGELYPKEKTDAGEPIQQVSKSTNAYGGVDTEVTGVVPTEKPISPKPQTETGVQPSIEPISEGTAERTAPVLEKMSDAEIENRLSEIEGVKEFKDEFNILEKEIEKRERDSVFNVPLEKVNDAIDALMRKEAEKPNGYGAFIEKREARETKEVADRYLNAKDLTDAEIKKDFSDAVRGNPTKSYADGLKMREALKEASNRGIDTTEMLEEVVRVYTNEGYDIETAKSVVANMIKPVFEGSQKVETSESKLITEPTPKKPALKDVESTAKALEVVSDKEIEKLDRKANKGRQGEWAVVTDEQGNVISGQLESDKGIISPNAGVNWEVDKPSIIIHTHPDNSIFSIEDIAMLWRGATKEIRVVLPNGEVVSAKRVIPEGETYSDRLRLRRGTIPQIKELWNEIENEIFESGKSKELTVEQIIDKINEELAPKIGVEISRKKISDYKNEAWVNQLKSNRSRISESYHKAKADGSNPELVKAVEELLGKPKEATLQAGNVVGGDVRTPEGFTNRVFEKNTQLGIAPKNAHISEKGYNYRVLSQKEIDAIKYSGGVFPREGKQKGGNSNTKYWTKGNNENWYGDKEGQETIRVKQNNFKENEVVKAEDVEVYNKETKKFEPLIIEQPITPEQAKAEPPSGGEPPVIDAEGNISATPESIRGITIEANAERRKDWGMFERDKKPETFEQWDAEAEKLISDGYDINKLLDKMERGEATTPVENSIRKIYAATLDKLIAENPTDELLAQAKRYAEAEAKSNAQAGKNLVSLKGNGTPRDTLADFYVAKMEDLNVDRLNENQKAEVKQAFEKIKAEREEFKRLYEEAENKLKDQEAQIELLKTQKETKTARVKKIFTGGKRDFAAEREAKKNELKKLIDEYKASGQKLGVQADGGAEGFVISAKIAKAVMDIVKLHVEEVGTKLDEVVKRTLNDVKGLIDGVTERDVRDIIRGVYSEKKQTRDEIVSQVRQIREEQKLLDEYIALTKKEFKDEKKSIKKEQRLKEIRDKVNELKKEQGIGQFSDEAKAKAIIDRNSKREAELRRKLAAGEFEQKPKPKTIFDSPDFKKNNPALYNKVLDSYNRVQEAQLEFEKGLLKNEMDNSGLAQKFALGLRKTRGTLKAFYAGVDLSAALVQNAFMFFRNPVTWGRAFMMSLKDLASEKRFDRYLAELHNSPDWPVIKESGLRVSEPKSLLEEGREEAFPDRWRAVVKFKGKEFGRVSIGGKKYELFDLLKPFERAFTSMSNANRVIAFREGAKQLYKKGFTFENNPEKFKKLATRLNNATGAGDINEGLKKVPTIANSLIWSTRLMAAKLNLLGISDAFALVTAGKMGTKGYYRSLGEKGKVLSAEQKAAVRDLAQFAIAATALSHSIALATGGTLQADPQEDDFMDIELPNGKRVNVTGGFSSYIAKITQIARGGKKDKFGVYKDYEGDDSRGSETMKFLRGKMPPISASLVNLAVGKDFMGKETDFLKEAEKYKMPLAIGQIAEQIKEDGALSMFYEGIPTFLGVNIKPASKYAYKFKEDTKKFIEDKQIEINYPGRNIVDKGIKRKMTDEEYAKYTQRIAERIEDGIIQLKEKGLRSGKTDKDSMQEAIDEIMSDAFSLAKKEIFGFERKVEKAPEMINQYRPLKFERKTP